MTTSAVKQQGEAKSLQQILAQWLGTTHPHAMLALPRVEQSCCSLLSRCSKQTGGTVSLSSDMSVTLSTWCARDWQTAVQQAVEPPQISALLVVASYWLSAKFWCPRLYQVPLSNLIRLLAEHCEVEAEETVVTRVEEMLHEAEMLVLRCADYTIPL